MLLQPAPEANYKVWLSFLNYLLALACTYAHKIVAKPPGAITRVMVAPSSFRACTAAGLQMAIKRTYVDLG
jgi:hypothetical protein